MEYTKEKDGVIIEKDKSPVRFEVQMNEDNQAFISDFYVTKQQRGNGYASEALDEIESRIDNYYSGEYEILVRIGNAGPVVPFLKKHGYSTVQERPTVVAKKN